jgi:CDI immunity protein
MMTTLDGERQGKRADVIATSKFLEVVTMSGLGLLYADPQSEAQILEANVDDAEVGSAILAALFKSRFVTNEELQSVVKSKIVQTRLEKMTKAFVKRFHYKNKTELRKDEKVVSTKLVKQFIEFMPNHIRTLGRYSGLGKDHHVVIPVDSSPAEVGAAFRLALSRCTSRYKA